MTQKPLQTYKVSVNQQLTVNRLEKTEPNILITDPDYRHLTNYPNKPRHFKMQTVNRTSKKGLKGFQKALRCDHLRDSNNTTAPLKKVFTGNKKYNK